MGQQADPMMSAGDVMREIRDIKRRLTTIENEPRLESASIGPGGITVKGGFIRILDTEGNETARWATDNLSLAGLLRVVGDIYVDGGEIEVVDADGDTVFRADADGVTLAGLLDVLGSIQVEVGGSITAANFDGDLDEDDPGSQGWALGDDKAAFAQLLLRDGIIADDKLSNLVRTDTDGSTLDTESVSSVESTSLALAVPSWATDVSVLAIGSGYLAGIADSPSMEIYCSIEGNEGIHMATHVDRASGNATAHHQRSIATSTISGDLNVSLTAEVNTPSDAFGLRLALSVIVVWSR